MCEIEFMPYFVVWTRTGCSVPSLPRFTHSFIQCINKLKTDLKLVYTSFKTTKYTAYTHPHYTLSLRIAFVINDLKFGKYWSPIFSYLFPHSTPILFLYCFPFVKKFVILLFSLCLFLPFPGFLLSFLKFLKSGLIVPLACEYIAIRQGLTLHRAFCGPHTRPTVCDKLCTGLTPKLCTDTTLLLMYCICRTCTQSGTVWPAR